MISISDLALLSLAALGVGSAISYAWWSKLRVIGLREDIYAIRDELWDAARRSHAFDNEEYQATREVLHSCIQGAALISLPVILVNVFVIARHIKSPNPPREPSPSELPEGSIERAIATATAKVTTRIVRYIIFDRFFSGGLLFLAIWALAMLIGKAKKLDPNALATQWIKDRGPRGAAVAALSL